MSEHEETAPEAASPRPTEDDANAPRISLGLPPRPDEPGEDLPTNSLAPSRMPDKSSLRSGPRPIAKAELWAHGVWYAGVILWSYVVVGEYVLGAGLPEVLGWSCFVGVLVGTFLQAANRTGVSLMGRTAGLGFVAVVGLVLFVSSLVGTSSRSEYQGISALFLLVAIGAIFFGVWRANKLRLLAGAPKKKLSWPKVATWLIFGGNSLLIMAAFLSQI